MTILVTGAAGFIGANTCKALLERGERVVGLDNYNDYYAPQIKRDRVAALCPDADIRVLDLTDRDGLAALFDEVQPTRVIHLAAQAGVRYSLENPHAYVDSNLTGFVNMLELCRHRGVAHLVYASSSSVYGDSATPPFSEDQRIDKPRSLYAATKAANELMAYTYAQLYGLHATGLRFFTVYGPWGRPDMAPLLFARAVLAGRPIDVFNDGKMQRDFTCLRHRGWHPRRAGASVQRHGAAPGVQPRQPHPDRAGALHRHHRGGRRTPGAEGLQADAARRHGPHDGRHHVCA
jgi:UDP-glucuronate 4-epimerase